MKPLQSYRITHAFPYDSISFCEEIFPGFTIIRNKIVKCNYFNLWRTQFLKKPKSSPIFVEKQNQIQYLDLFINHFQEKQILRKFYSQWKWRTNELRISKITNNSNDDEDNTALSKEINEAVDPKYIEFMTELQESISHEANLKTTISVLDKKLAELTDVETQTRVKADRLLRKCDIASSTYESLLRQLSEMKITHRDHIAALQVQIGKSHDSFVSHSSSEILESISQDQAKFQEKSTHLKDLIEKEKEKAAILRTQIQLLEKENQEEENEIKYLKEEIEDFPNPELKPYQVEPNSKIVELKKLLMTADQQLQATSAILQKQTNQIKELDLQIIKDRVTLDQLRNPPSHKKMIPKKSRLVTQY
ncbi:hypothetical protein TRFO_07412 [Tritrichomonas foetus]|uniref:Uncharacterized protein n=1 Tax=Tritrichomonas foetus TaxID=1144522 RepID=A0A1J4JWD5_9EUKA|nr:hypothetical protein TRFO_07412 [Tritrichomonas foetus]|eukprot:OHT01838.1 hypothetical protein TRFO_07412 [Tritrichomonas foetus]